MQMMIKELTQNLEKNRVWLCVALEIAGKASVVAGLLSENFLEEKQGGEGWGWWLWWWWWWWWWWWVIIDLVLWWEPCVIYVWHCVASEIHTPRKNYKFIRAAVVLSDRLSIHMYVSDTEGFRNSHVEIYMQSVVPYNIWYISMLLWFGWTHKFLHWAICPFRIELVLKILRRKESTRKDS